MVLDFFETKPKIVDALLNKNSSGHMQSGLQNPLNYYSMSGMNNWGFVWYFLFYFIFIVSNVWKFPY